MPYFVSSASTQSFSVEVIKIYFFDIFLFPAHGFSTSTMLLACISSRYPRNCINHEHNKAIMPRTSLWCLFCCEISFFQKRIKNLCLMKFIQLIGFTWKKRLWGMVRLRLGEKDFRSIIRPSHWEGFSINSLAEWLVCIKKDLARHKLSFKW